MNYDSSNPSVVEDYGDYSPSFKTLLRFAEETKLGGKMIQKVVFMVALIIFLPVYAYGAQGDECPETERGSKHGNLGARHWEAGRYQQAEEETRLAIKYDTDCSMWHQNLGFILSSMGRTDEANKSFLKSLEVDKYWCTAFKTGSLMSVGSYYYQRKNYSKSIDYLNRAILMAEKEHVGKRDLSLIYTYLSYNYTGPKEDGNSYFNLEVAEKYKRKALLLNPDDLFIKTSLAKLLVLQGKLADAKRNISEIIEEENRSSSPNPAVYSYIAHVYSLLGEPKQSAMFMNKAMDLSPQYAADYLLSELKRDFKNVATAEEMKPVITRARKIRQP